MKNFAITGVAGYIAPRHLHAIKETGNALIAALDPHDSVGILDRYFTDVPYFKDFERFDRYLDKYRRNRELPGLDYLSICSPNYLHDAHIRLALRLGADALCEKPLVLNPWNLDALQELEAESGRRIYTVLQLRLHPSIVALRERVRAERETGKKHRISLTYLTSRGPWYQYSWKGNLQQSGGLASNIGIHFFDMLIWTFGAVLGQEVTSASSTNVAGTLELERAIVDWRLSIDRHDLPAACVAAGKTTYRSITVDDEEVEFSDGFADLHVRVYEDVLAGGGFGIDDVRPSVQLAYDIRKLSAVFAASQK